MTTQYANAQYQEIIDLHTESNRVSVVGIHTPCSDTPYHMLKGFWNQFKKFKYNGCSITMVPSATLPVDPLQVSYDAGEPTIDPRDTLNPIMFHGCHGDDMGAILNALYSEPSTSAYADIIDSQSTDSTEHAKFITGSTPVAYQSVYETLYYRALTDKTWLKAHPQRGFRKNGLHPMIYSVASTVQLGNLNSPSPGLNPKGVVHDDDDGDASMVNTGTFGLGSSPAVYGTRGYGRPYVDLQSGYVVNPVTPSPTGFLTPRLQRLGWMDTRQVVGLGSSDKVDENVTELGDLGVAEAHLYKDSSQHLVPTMTPKIFMGMILLPPAYKTMQHFRLILNHSFSFAKFRGASMQYDTPGEVLQPYGYFNYSDLSDSKRSIDPEPDEKGDEKDGN